MKRPKLNMLRTFEVAGRKLSFSLAAQELNISQAAVSQQIRNLETYLGTTLFIRNHRQLSLNPVGLAYHDVVQETLDRLDAVTDQLFPDRSRPVVTIRCTSSIATLWLVPQIRIFQKNHPSIDLRIQTLNSDLTDGYASSVDLEIFISKKEVVNPHTQKLLTSIITPVVAPSLLSNSTETGTPFDVLSFELIHVIGYDDDWHRWFRKQGLNDVAIPRGLVVDGTLIALEAVFRGDGVMLGRRPFIDQYLETGQLVELFANSHSLSTNYYLRQTPTRTLSKATKKVAAWLLDISKRNDPLYHQ